MANFVGNNNANTLVGTPDNDSFQARGGNDTISGGGGNDTIDAGTGDDTARGGRGDDSIAAGAGNDLLGAGGGNNILSGGPGADTFEIDLGAGGDNDINLITDFQDGTDQIHLLVDGAPLGTALVNTMETIAGISAPFNALNEEDDEFGAHLPVVTVLQGDLSDVWQFDGFFVEPHFGLDFPSTDVLNVVGVHQLELDVNPAGTDLFLV